MDVSVTRQSVTAGPSMLCWATNTSRAGPSSETALPRRQVLFNRHLAAGRRPRHSPPPPYGRRPRPCPLRPPLGAARAAGAAPSSGRLLRLWHRPSRCRRPHRWPLSQWAVGGSDPGACAGCLREGIRCRVAGVGMDQSRP